MAVTILEIIAAVFGVVASYVIGGQIVRWLQMYYTARGKDEIEAIRKAQQAANQAANKESDKLKEKDGR